MNKIPVLKIRDENGNFIPINAIRGDNGKSAYEQAQEGGYKGTEAEFIALLNGLTSSEDSEHYSDFTNPHKVTAAQTGAIPEVYSASTDLNNELQQGGNKLKVCNYHSGTLNTPHKEGLTVFAHGMVITNAHNSQYGTQLCLPSGEDAIYVRTINGNGITPWKKVADTSAISSMLATLSEQSERITTVEESAMKITTGSYRGTDTYGGNNPNKLTFDFVPKFVFVGLRGNSNFNSGATFLWVNPGTTLNFCNNGSNYWVYPTLLGNSLCWYNTVSPSYQLNSSSKDYDYLAWG